MAAPRSANLRSSIGRAVHCVIPAGSRSAEPVFARLDETNEPLLHGGHGKDSSPPRRAAARSTPPSLHRSPTFGRTSKEDPTTAWALGQVPQDAETAGGPASIFCFLRGGLSVSPVACLDLALGDHRRGDVSSPPPPTASRPETSSESSYVARSARVSTPNQVQATVNETSKGRERLPPSALLPRASTLGSNAPAVVPRTSYAIDSPTKSFASLPNHRSLSEKFTKGNRAPKGGSRSVQTYPLPSTLPDKVGSQHHPPTRSPASPSKNLTRRQPRPLTGENPRPPNEQGTPRRTRSTSRTRNSGPMHAKGANRSPSRRRSPKRILVSNKSAALSANKRGEQRHSPRPQMSRGSAPPVDPSASQARLDSQTHIRASSRDATTRRKAVVGQAADKGVASEPVMARRHPQRPSRPQALSPRVEDPLSPSPNGVNGALKRKPATRTRGPVPKQVEFTSSARDRQPRSPRSVTSTETPTVTTELSMTLSSNHSSATTTSWNVHNELPHWPLPRRHPARANAARESKDWLQAVDFSPSALNWTVTDESFGSDDFMKWDPNDFDFDDDDFFAVKAD